MPEETKKPEWTTLEKNLGRLLLTLRRDAATWAYLEITNKTLAVQLEEALDDWNNHRSEVEAIVAFNTPVYVPERIDNVADQISAEDRKEFIHTNEEKAMLAKQQQKEMDSFSKLLPK